MRVLPGGCGVRLRACVMGVDYIPESDSKAAVWMEVFAGKVVADPGAYFVSEEDAQAVDDAVMLFRQALTVSLTPETRTQPNVIRKNELRAEAERVVRQTAQRIRVDGRVSEMLRFSLGLRTTAQRRKYVGPPAGVPVLFVVHGLPGMVKVVVRDSVSQIGAARPKEAAGVQLFEAHPLLVGQHPDGGNIAIAEENLRLVGTFTRWPALVKPTVTMDGQNVTLVGRWITRRGETGPFGTPVSIRLLTANMTFNNAVTNTRQRAA